MKRKIGIALVLALLTGLLCCGGALALITTGQLGENVVYQDNGTGTIQVTGEGATYDYGFASNLSPLDGKDMEAVIFEKGVTYLGNNVLCENDALTSVLIRNPDAVISDIAIRFCNENITIYGWEGSTAAAFAEDKGYDFRSLGALTGSCGDGVTYSFDLDTGRMTVSGTGPMADYPSASDVPWEDFKYRIVSVVIESGVTRVGRYSFTDCYGLTSGFVMNPSAVLDGSEFCVVDVFEGPPIDVTIHGYPASTAETYAQSNAWFTFEPLAPAPTLILPDDLTTIKADAFRNVTAEAALFPKSVNTIEGNPFADSGVRYLYGFPGTAVEGLANAYPAQFSFIPVDEAYYARLTD